jgi:hypothetical protein
MESTLIGVCGKSLVSASAIIYGAIYAEPVAKFLGRYLVNVVSSDKLIKAAQEFSRAAGGFGMNRAGIAGALGFSALTLAIKEFADTSIKDNLLSWKSEDDTIESLKDAIVYVTGSGVTGGVMYFGLKLSGFYAAPTAAAVVGAALTVHLACRLLWNFRGIIDNTAGKAISGGLIGAGVVVGKRLFGHVEVFFKLTPSGVGLTYSVAVPLAGLTLGIKNLTTKFFDNLIITPGKFNVAEKQYNSNKEETGFNYGYDEDDDDRSLDPKKGVLRFARNVGVELAGSAAAGAIVYCGVTVLNLVSGPTSKLVIGTTLVAQMALKGLFHINGAKNLLLFV